MDYEAITHHTGTVLVEFYASWRPHCQRMIPVVEQVKQLLGEQVPVYQFDIDKEPKASDEAGVQSVPTFIVYRNGREMWRQSGEMEAATLVSTAEKYLSGDS